MDDIGIAVIGYGGMGRYHCGHLIPKSGFRVRGIYDTDKSRYAVAARDGLDAHAFSSIEEIAADKTVDAVLVATPNDSHREYAEFFASAGKHVICEKPAARSSEELSSMLAAAEKNNVVLAIHQNRRWDADFLTVKRLYDIGKRGGDDGVGKVLRIESRVQGGNGIPGDWRKFKEKGGGMMLDWGVHLIDQCVVMMGKPEGVYCSYSHSAGFEVDDGFRLLLEYPDASVEITVDTDCYIRTPRWIVYGADGTAIVEDWDLNGKVVKPIFSAERKIAGIKAGNGFTKTMAYRTADSLVTQDLVRESPTENAFYNEFYAAVKSGRPMSIEAEQVMLVMKIMEAANMSAADHVAVKL